MNNVSSEQIQQINSINNNTKAMMFGTKIQTIISTLNGIASKGTPVNAVNASKVLTISGVVKDGEKVTINNPAISGSNVYEFLADDDQTKTAETNIGVDITSHVTKASNTLTVDTQPTSGNTMTIGGKVYTFVPNNTDTADGEISIGTDLASAQAAIVAAINGTDEFNEPNMLVSAGEFASDDCVITALIGGTSGNAIGTVETFTALTNVFSAATLGSGADCSAANAVTALVAAITADDTQGVGAADGVGNTVDLTADVAGVVGNAIQIGETMVNGAFAAGATTLSGGVDGTVGSENQFMIDDSYLYHCIDTNTTTGKNWRRISLGSVY
jgi:hypothetical protein